ncbi:membrane protein insertase YidC [Flindersiella endophytica]
MLSVIDSVVALAGSGVAAIASFLTPLLGDGSTVAAIIICTVAVRLLLMPLSRMAIRSANAQRALRPKELELRKQHASNPGRLLRELADLRRTHGVSQFASIWPMLAQAPVVAVLYRLFTAPMIGGTTNLLLTHTLFGLPLGGRFLAGLPGILVSPDLLVYLAVFVLIAVVAWWSARLTRQLMPPPGPELETVPGVAAMTKVTPFLAYGTLLAAAFAPLAAALYLLTSTAWSTVERWAWAGRSA